MKWQICIYSFLVPVLLSGCAMMNERVISSEQSVPQQSIAPEPKKVTEPNRQEMRRRFETNQNTESSPVQNSVIWAQKYEELSLRNNELREQNNKILQENNRLDRETEKLSTELEQTKKDLAEANAFLQQMHLELNEWKTDVLGFRNEIRQSQKAQLEALSKILSVLGAEPVTVPDAGEEKTVSNKGS